MSHDEIVEIVRAVAAELGGPELLTYAQAAELVSVGKSTIREWVAAGQLKKRGRGRCPRVSRRELLAFMSGDGPTRGPSDSNLDAVAAAALRRLT